MRTLLTLRLVVSVGVTLVAIALVTPATWSAGPAEAPTGFDVDTGENAVSPNGFTEEFCANQAALTNSPNSPRIPTNECDFETAAEEFTGPEGLADGLGPIFNGNGCGECHLVPTLGGGSQIVEKRAGYFDPLRNLFTDHPGGSLIQDRALLDTTFPFDALAFQEFTIPAKQLVTTFRGTISLFGDGFVEAIDSNTIENLRRDQPFSIRGKRIEVPVGEAPNHDRTGRFGWKNQQASLVSFSADAYKNEMGITSPLDSEENTSNGRPVPDPHPGEPGTPDDEGVDVELFAVFMRSLKAPPRDLVLAATPDAQAGSNIFNSLGCAQCHTRTITTAPPGTLINGGALKVSEALGNKIIHPFSDFLLHDIDTGDGIVQNGGQDTRNMVRTAPLWGLRARSRFMHDNLSFNLTEAILRHGNQARDASDNFRALGSSSKDRLLKFLLSL
jgi:CxxC motif-containing protein (DUF1111 family)